MKVIFAGAGPGDPELITVKVSKLIQDARCCIYAGSLINPQITDLLPQTCRAYDSAGMSLEDMKEVFLSCKEEGIDCLRLHTGEPSIYGAIGEQMKLLNALEIEYEVIPGISSFQAAAATLKTELTSPEVSQTVILTRTSGRTPLPDSQKLEKLAESRSTLCIFLSSHKIDDVCDTLIPFYGPECPAAIVYHASWPDQQIIRGTLQDIPAKSEGITRTAIIIVGPAIDGVLHESKLYDKTFTHGYRQGAK